MARWVLPAGAVIPGPAGKGKGGAVAGSEEAPTAAETFPGQAPAQHPEESIPGDHLRPELLQMLRLDLAVDKLEIPGRQLLNQGDEGGLGGIGDPAEHGFAEEYPAQRDAVETAGQTVLPPDFHGMGQTHFMETDIGRLHPGGDPSPFPTPPFFLAGRHHVGKAGVESDGKDPAPD